MNCICGFLLCRQLGLVGQKEGVKPIAPDVSVPGLRKNDFRLFLIQQKYFFPVFQVLVRDCFFQFSTPCGRRMP